MLYYCPNAVLFFIFALHTVLGVGFGGSSGLFRTAPCSGSGSSGWSRALSNPIWSILKIHQNPLLESGAVLNDPEDPQKCTSRIFETIMTSPKAGLLSKIEKN